jgi:hypothetical protein
MKKFLCFIVFHLFLVLSPGYGSGFPNIAQLDDDVYVEASKLALNAYKNMERISKFEEEHNGTTHYFIKGKTGCTKYPNEHTLATVTFPADTSIGIQRVFVAYHGSSYLDDWFSDFNTMSIDSPFGHGKTHKGFYEAAASTFKNLDECFQHKIKTTKLDSLEFIFTGHSLGGALATLSGFWFFHKFHQIFSGAILKPNQIKTITFSAPKVGDDEFSFYYDSKLKDSTLRFKCKADTVPTQPFWFSTFGRSVDVYLSENIGAAIDELTFSFSKPQHLHGIVNTIVWVGDTILGFFTAGKIATAIKYGGKVVITAHRISDEETLKNAYKHFIESVAFSDNPEDVASAGSPKYWSPRNPIRKVIGF